MPTTRQFRGDAAPRAKQYKISPLIGKVGATYTVRRNGKAASHTATVASVSSVVDGLVAAINAATTIPEFAELTAADAGDHLTLTAKTAGQDFRISVSATGTATVTVEYTVDHFGPNQSSGREAVNEVQLLQLLGTPTGGTFALVNDFGGGTETTVAIPYGATASTVQAAIEGLPSVAPGDVTVVPSTATLYYLYWGGNFAGVEIPEFDVDGSGLTGSGEITIFEQQRGGALTDSVLYQRADLSGGTIRFRYLGNDTAPLSYDATQAECQTALETLPGLAGNITVYRGVSTSTGMTTLVYHLHGDLAGINFTTTRPSWVLDDAVSTVLAGGTIQQGGQTPRAELLVVHNGNATGGTFTLSCDGDTSGLLAFEADDADVQAAVEDFAATTETCRVHNFAGLFVVLFSGGTDQPEITIGAGNLTGETETPYVAVLQHGGGEVNEIQEVRVYAGGGSFTLSVTHGGSTEATAAIAYGAAASDVKAALELLSNVTTVTVTGTGTDADPYVVEFDDPGLVDVPTMGHDAALLTGGDGTCSEQVAHDAGENAQQTISRDREATGGTFTLAETADGTPTDPIPYDASDAVMQAALETVYGAGNVSVTKPADNTWLVEWIADSAKTPINLLVADPLLLEGGGEAITLEVAAWSTGPEHWDEPLNWIDASGEGGVPERGDTAYIDGETAITQGLRQLAVCTAGASAAFTADAGTDLLTLGADLALADGQVVRVRSDGMLPSGLAAATDYYVVNHDAVDGTLQLSLTLDGAAVGIADAGTGTHTLYDPYTLSVGTEGADFVEGQAVDLTTTGTLPAGLAPDTTYYVSDWDKRAGTLQLALAEGGSAVVITDAGTGTHEIGVQLARLQRSSRHTGAIGLPRRNAEGYWEDRPRSLRLGVDELVQGAGGSQGAGRFNLDHGQRELHVVCLSTGGRLEADVPPLLLKGTHPGCSLELLDGDLGMALWPGEAWQFDSLKQRGGSLELGQGVTGTGTIDKTGGTLLADEADLTSVTYTSRG